MRFVPLAAAAAWLATVSHGFLLPPTISSSDKDIVNTLPFVDALARDERTVMLECPRCPIEVSNFRGAAVLPTESVLRFNFSLSPNDGGADALMLNGLQVYPVNPGSKIWEVVLTADQLAKSPSGTWDYAGSPELGFALRIHHVDKTSPSDNLGLVILTLDVLDLHHIAVEGIPRLELTVVETQSGKLMIAEDKPVYFEKPAKVGTECTTVVCAWRAYFADKVSKLGGGCAGKGRHQGHTMKPSVNQDGSPHPHGPRPHGHGPHRPHRHHHKHNGFSRILRVVVLRVLIPVMIGLLVGATASIVGIVVGQVAICIWRTLFRRGGRSAYTKVQSEDVSDDDQEQTKSFLQHQDAPPVYEDAPEYEEVVADARASE
jgi:hypothetical protein